MYLRLAVGLVGMSLLGGTLLRAQTTQPPVYPVVSVAPPGTTTPAPVLLVQMPTGFAQQIVTSFSQRCITTPASSTPGSTFGEGLAATTCTTLAGDRRLLNRSGSALLPNGSSLLGRQSANQTGNLEDLPTIGIDILDESSPLNPAIREFATLDNGQVNCIVSGSGQATRSERSIVWFTYNEPLNTLYVLTRNSTRFYQFPTGVTPGSSSCVDPSVATEAGVQVVEDRTDALIRVVGPFNNSNVQSSLPVAAGR